MPARAFFALFLTLFLSVRAAAADVPSHFFLEADVAIERGGNPSLFFDYGYGFWGDHGFLGTVLPGTTPTTVRLQMPTRPIRALRFDPATNDSPIDITGLRLVTDRGELLLRIDPKTLRPWHQIQAIEPIPGGVRIRPTPKADDPMLHLDFEPLQQRMHAAMQRTTVGPGTVTALAVLLAALVGTAIAMAWRALGRRELRLGAAALFCLVFGARLWALDHFSRSTPFWDEWDGDVLYVLIPFTGGFLDWGALFMPQWEHRILLTRVIALAGTVLNGEWDPRVAMTLSAAIYATTVTLVGTALLATGTRLGALAATALALAAALPYDVNNLLWGGQTQMYALVLLTVCTLALASAPRVTPAIYLGAFAGSLISLFTMGAGLVGPGCAVGLCLVRCCYERDQRRALAALATIFFSAALLGLFLHTASRAHVPLYATTFAQFQRAFVGALSWPLPPHAFWAAFIWLPSVTNGVLLLRRRSATTLEWLCVGLGTWGLINAVALGYARQYEGPPFDTRFFTPFSIGVMASFGSSVALALRATTWRGRTPPLLAWGTVACAFVVVGYIGIGVARESRSNRAGSDEALRHYLTTGDRGPLLAKPPNHTGLDVIERLDSPLFRRVMAAPYRRILAARTPGAAPAEQGPVTTVARTFMKCGIAILGLGVAGLALFHWRVRLTPAPLSPSAPPSPAWALPSWRTLRERADYIGAAALVVGWLVIYVIARPAGLVDEPGHLAAIYHFLGEKTGWPEAMPMLPGYHYIVVALVNVFPGVEVLTLARAVTALTALVGLAAFALAWRRLHGQSAGRATLLLALLPLTQPFTALAYTDVPALACVFVALWAHLTGRRAFAALLLAAAVALRQTSLAWAGFLIAWEFLRSDEPRRTFLARIAWQAALLAVAAILILAAGRLTLGSQHGNDFRFNPATLHFAGLLLLVLGLPVWLAHAPAAWRQTRALLRTHPARSAALLTLALAAATGLALTFANPHVWNRELFWDGCSFTLLRNWPLVWLDAHPWLRVLSGLNLVLMATALALVFSRQPHRHALWLALGIGLLPAFTNSLVEPRYFIPAAGVLLLYLRIPAPDTRRLAWWWGALSLLHAPFIARGLSLW